MEWRILVKNEKVIILTVGNLKKKRTLLIYQLTKERRQVKIHSQREKHAHTDVTANHQWGI